MMTPSSRTLRQTVAPWTDAIEASPPPRHDCAFAEAPEASSILLRVGTAIIGGLLAILGAAAGSALTYVLQRKMAVRAEEFAVAERVRAEGMAAFSSFASAAMEARRAQVDRWYQRRDAGPGSDEYRSAKDESFRCRAAAWQVLFRAQLVSDSDELNSRATELLDGIGRLHKAQTKDDLDQEADKWRDGVGLLRRGGASSNRCGSRAHRWVVQGSVGSHPHVSSRLCA